MFLDSAADYRVTMQIKWPVIRSIGWLELFLVIVVSRCFACIKHEILYRQEVELMPAQLGSRYDQCKSTSAVSRIMVGV